MKKYILIIVSAFVVGVLSSCQDMFLQMPNVSGTQNLDKIYSDSTSAIQILVSNYRSTMTIGWGGYVSSNYQTGWYHGNIAAISGEIVKGQSWHGNFAFATSGPAAAGLPGVSQSNPLDAFSFAPFSRIYPGIRANFLLIENIDKVPNISAANKVIIKAEAKGLLAYWYLYLLKNYGGVPLVKKSLLPTDAPIERSSLQETIDYTLQLADESIADLPDSWPANLNGRLTKAAIMTLKSEVRIIAARPLFNSSAPYMESGKNNPLIWLGNEDPTRWLAVITETEAALAQAKLEGKDILNTGGVGVGVANPKAIDDYGAATSTPSNNELILSCHNDDVATGYYTNTSYYQTNARYNNQYGMPRSMIMNYLKADGNEQSWPSSNDIFPRPGSDYVTRFKQMEPRFLVDLIGPGIEASTNNPGINQWSAKGWTLTMSNRVSAFPNGSTAFGCALPVKFFYKAGNRLWYEYPIYRVAQLYLQLAEAYNEVGNSTKALENLNIVHNRAGLNSITEVDQAKLRKLIQREWDVEFFNEGKRYYNYRQWKRDDIGLGSMYGPVEEFQFQTLTNNVNLAANLITYWSAYTHTTYWNPKMYLEPFPQTEINKGTIIQNPGY